MQYPYIGVFLNSYQVEVDKTREFKLFLEIKFVTHTLVHKTNHLQDSLNITGAPHLLKYSNTDRNSYIHTVPRTDYFTVTFLVLCVFRESSKEQN